MVLVVAYYKGRIMEGTAPSLLEHWQNFYVIVGSSAGALTGLQFVVIALIAEAQAARSTLEIRAFGTPTVVHFCVSLLIAAIMCAPWHTLSALAFVLGICGVAAAIYAMLVIHHARRTTNYIPDLEDWFWYVGLPFVAYAVLAVTAFYLPNHPSPALFVVAAVAILLLFIGIHNAWDSVTYITVKHSQRVRDHEE
jgi:hypothetical protein